MAYLNIQFANGNRILARYMFRKDASSIFRYETKDGTYGEFNITDVVGITTETIYPA